ncbi:MAG: RNA-binding protein [Chthoniobacterales bacterium]|nr:RNA-binding protein [Chthoniobacterales bacterium]
MSSKYSSSPRGPRSQSGRRSYSSSKKPSYSSARPPKPTKSSFWSKLLGFLGLGKPSSSLQKKKPYSKKESTFETKERTPRVPRKPEYVEVTGPRLYVGNLSFEASESDLFELFSGVGQVQNVELVSNKDTHRSKGFGFVQMTSLEEAKRAVSELHDKEYMGRKLVVSGAKALPENRTERPAPAAAASEEAPSEGECCGGNCHCAASEE